MKEIIILEINKGHQSQLIQNFLKSKKVDYRILMETLPKQPINSSKPRAKNSKKIDIFANYGRAIKNKEREKELKLWNNVDLDEELNNDGEWWS
ncbi:MAG: hypothetical protein MRERV_1c032 [Mycoplasmataceae bacterium RV_VA103A]|nr:MAG: hypothetical protein MRERV_1c032 [Mycoplasmataceae bacterium RV_VA103A]